jgi:hypothetical protein
MNSKKARRCYKEEGSEGKKRQEMETQAQTISTLVLDQIIIFTFCSMLRN